MVSADAGLPSTHLVELLVDVFHLDSLLTQEVGATRKQLRRLSGNRPSEATVLKLLEHILQPVTNGQTLGIALPSDAPQSLARILVWLMALADQRVLTREVIEDLFPQRLAPHLAGYWLSTGDPVPDRLPSWMLGKKDRFARDLLLRKRSRASLKAELKGAGVRTIEGLLAGEIAMSDETIVRVARLASEPGTFHRTCGQVRVHYALRRLWDAYVDQFDESAARSLATETLRYTRAVHRVLQVLRDQGVLGDDHSPALLKVVYRGIAGVPYLPFRFAVSALPDQEVASRLLALVTKVNMPPTRLGDSGWIEQLTAVLGDGTAVASLRVEDAVRRMRAAAPTAGDEIGARRQIKSNPDDPAGYLRMCFILQQRGENEKIEELVRSAPDPVRADPYCRLHLAAALGRQGRYDDALAELDEVRTDAPDLPELHVLLTAIYAQQGRPGLMKKSALRAAKLGRPLGRALIEVEPPLLGDQR